MSINGILRDLGVDTVSAGRPRMWEKKKERLLVGRITSFEVRIEDEQKKLHTVVERHDGEMVTAYHTSGLAYKLCELAGVQWKETDTHGPLESLLGENILIYLRGQNVEKNNRYEFQVNHIQCAFDQLTEIFDRVSEGVDTTPITNDGPDGDL